MAIKLSLNLFCLGIVAFESLLNTEDLKSALWEHSIVFAKIDISDAISMPGSWF